MEARDTTPSSRIIAGRYRLGARLGSGVEAAFFEAFDEQLQRLVVLKMVHPDLSALPHVQHEFSTMLPNVAEVHHPNVAAVFDWGTTSWNDRDVLYVVSERLTGGSLRDLLDRGRLLSPSQLVVVGLDACKALDALHRQGLVHTDVRPSTLVFGDDRRLRLVDAGLAQVLHDAAGDVNGRDVDIAKYASPEEALGEQLRPKSDIYSLCLALLESITGSVPFIGDSAVSTLANRVGRLMPVSADLGPLASVMERAGRPIAGDRYSAAEFGRALVQAAEKLPRPAALPIIVAPVAADPGGADQPVEPTGPLQRPDPAAVEPAVVQPATVVSAVVVPPVAPLPPPVRPPPSSAEIVDEFDPADEFPERPTGSSANRRWFVVALLLMAIAGGVLAWYNSKPETAEVPVLAGLRQGEALNQLGPFTPLIEEEASETVEPGVVIGTEPVAGTVLEHDSEVTIIVSTGPAPRPLPELVGLTVAEATDALTELGLVLVEGTPVFDEFAEPGVVVSWTVPAAPTLVAGATVVKGTTVQVIASSGPAPRTVPELRTLTLADATAALDALGLVLAQAPDEFNNDAPIGQIIRQDQAPGATVERGTTITVVVSKGQDLVPLPDIIGLNFAQATTKLGEAGFGLNSTTGNGANPLIAVSVNGAPAAPGQLFLRNTKVDLAFQPDAPPPAP